MWAVPAWSPPRPSGTRPTARRSSSRPPRSSALRPSCCRELKRAGCPTPAPRVTSRSADAAAVVLDIGGGSTEIVTKAGGDILSVSLDIGCVRLTERFLPGDPPTAAEVAAAVQAIEAELDRAAEVIPPLADVSRSARLVGLAGTVSTLAAMELKLAGYDRERIHHAVLTAAAVRRWCDVLGAEPAGRAGSPPRLARGSTGRDLRRSAGVAGGHDPLRIRRVHRVGGRHPGRPRHVDAARTTARRRRPEGSLTSTSSAGGRSTGRRHLCAPAASRSPR